MRISDILTESFDRQQAIEAYKRLQASPKNFIDLTNEDQKLWQEVIQAVREKLNHMRDNHSEIKRDWPIVNQYIKQYESQVMMGGWDTWFKSGLIRHNPHISKAQVVNDPHDKLDVTKTMYDFAQWVFMGKDLEGKIKRNTLTKRDIPTIDKIRVLLRNPVTEARRHEQVFPRVEEEQLAVDHLKSLDKNELDQHYVHMGEASVKFGARPTIYHLDDGDPVGLYAYPATYWLKSTKPGILPYGENYPLIWIFRVDAALTVKPGSNKEKQAIQKLKKSHMLIANKFPGFKTKPQQLELAQVLSNLSAGNLISTLHEAAEYILSQDPTTHDRTRKSVIVTVLLIMLGVKFIRGYGGVIESEAVLLDTSAAQNIKLFNRSPGSVAKNPNRPTRDQRLSPERDEFEPIMYPSPPSTSSLSKYIRYAISQADQGKMPAEREKAEAKMYTILKPGSSRLSHYMADTDEFLQNLVVDYRDQVVHKLGIEWTNSKYAQFFNKLDYR